MGELSKEKLEAVATGRNYSVSTREVENMARELLALRKERERAEPDYIRYDCGCCGWETIEDWRDNDACPKCNHKPMGKTELYATPPAPVVPDEMPEPDTTRMFFTDAVAEIAKAQGWNACRAAMLNKSQPVAETPSADSRNKPGLVVAVHIDSGDFVKVKGRVFEVAQTEFDDHDVTLWFVGGDAFRCAAGCQVEVVRNPDLVAETDTTSQQFESLATSAGSGKHGQ